MAGKCDRFLTGTEVLTNIWGFFENFMSQSQMVIAESQFPLKTKFFYF